MNDTASPMPPVNVPRRRAVLGAGAAIAMGAGLAAYLLGRSTPQGIEIHRMPRALPPLHFTDAHGAATSLAAWRGRAVLLNIWATWCLPCREEMPSLDRLQAALGGPRFEVIALSIDTDGLPAVQAFFRSTGVRHLQAYLDANQEGARLALRGIPLSLLIDSEGREVARKLGAARWDDPDVRHLIRQVLAATDTTRP